MTRRRTLFRLFLNEGPQESVSHKSRMLQEVENLSLVGTMPISEIISIEK